MRALIVTTNLAGPARDGRAAAGNTWRPVIEAIGERVDGLVVAPAARDAPADERIGRLRLRRVRPSRPESSLSDAAVRSLPAAAALWRAARAAIRSGGFDVVHAFWAVPAGFAVTVPAQRVPVVLSAPGSDIHTWSARRVRGAPVRTALRRASVVVVHDAQSAATACAAGASRAVRLPVPFDPSWFALAPEIPDDPKIAYVGRMARAKGVLVLAEALGILARRVPDVHLVACGDGPERNALARAAGGRVTMTGPLPPSGVAAVLAGSRVAVQPSFAEGMSAAAVEALAVGRPVVCTNVGEHATLVAGSGGRLVAPGAGAGGRLVAPGAGAGGRLVAPGDAPGLAAALEAELRTRRDPHALRALVADLTPDRVASALVDLYASVVDTPETAARR